jgi:hypothetical protein
MPDQPDMPKIIVTPMEVYDDGVKFIDFEGCHLQVDLDPKRPAAVFGTYREDTAAEDVHAVAMPPEGVLVLAEQMRKWALAQIASRGGRNN